jgi:cyclic nucleotide-binding protein
MSAEPPAFPKALDDDDDDVTWALQTAQARWERGGHADAVVWLRRAAQSALELGEFGRAADLEKSARQIDLWVKLSESSGLAQSEEDDGVDALLEGDMPMLETRALDGPTPSLVDAIEAEARGESPLGPDPEELDDVEDVEELEDEEIIEELPESAMVEPGGDSAPLPSFALDSVPPPAPEEEAIDDVDVPELDPIAELVDPEPLAEPAAFPEPATETRQKSETRHALEEKPASSPLVAVEPEPMPPVPLRESEPPPPLPSFEAEPLTSDDAVTLKPPAAPRVFEPELEPEVADDEILLPDGPVPSVVATSPGIAPPPSERRTPAIDPERIASVPGLEDLTPEIHAELGARARTRKLAPDEEVGGYGLLWVMRGMVMVMPTIADAVVATAVEGQTVFARGNLEVNVALRAVAGPNGAEVAVWQPEHFEEVLEKCPWVADELRSIADRFQALAGASMGLLGDRLDDSMRAMVTDRAEVKLLLPGETIFEQNKPVVGLYVLGAGEIELVKGGSVERTLGPGELLFSAAVLAHEPAPALARAGAPGALVLYFDRMTTHELVVSVPPLLELVAMG